ncbi:MAG: triose-phosphate isomerase [Ruminococcaceae bacterium]|nr:triose-phosphate isomerase [Oscillospiraceae bacterium]
MRKKVIAGNWKMNMTPSQAVTLATEIINKNLENNDCGIVICVPAIDIAAVQPIIAHTNVKLGAQNVHFAPSGAFTGELSVDMLKESGVEYVIIGHSERRQYFGETDETVNKRVTAALEGGLKVILCVGELLEEREAGKTLEVVDTQTRKALEGIPASALANLIIAYEPVWAIGTGKVATTEQADEVCGIIRGIIADLYSKEAADEFIIQYGGSMNAKNAAELLAMPNIDGGLIGGASLKSDDFTVIIEKAQ